MKNRNEFVSSCAIGFDGCLRVMVNLIRGNGMNYGSVLLVAGVILFASFNLTGCGGGGAEIIASSTTLGQELIDLQDAYDKGVITKEEFDKTKKKLLKN